MDQSEKQKILEEYMRTPKGRGMLVASMRKPLMLQVRFRSLGLPESRVVQIKGDPRTFGIGAELTVRVV